MADGLFFNYWGVTHSLELCLFERPNVWRAIVDGVTVVFFEAGEDYDVNELFDHAIGAWVADGLNV